MDTSAPDSSGRPGGGATRPGLILALVCAAQFMVVLDIAIVNVALPSVQADLGLDQADLQWVVITYGIMLGGFLLLGGRTADLLGRRNVLVAGLALFTVSSLTAGLAGSLGQLVVSRAGQGLGAALASPAALSILVNTFDEGAPRNKALGIWGAVGGSAASVGVIVSGALTSGPGWEWIFFMNIPIGVVMGTLIWRLVPAGERSAQRGADLPGAITVTAGLMVVVYAINKGEDYGWTSGATLGLLGGGALLLGLFALVEQRSPAPLMPPAMFRRRTLNAANLGNFLVFGSFFATIFQASLFMQQVLRYSAMRTGVAYLAMATVSLVAAGGVAPRVAGRLGSGWSLAIGQVISAVGLVLLAQVPVDASYGAHLLPGFVLVGSGIGLSLVAAQVAAFIGVPREVAGLAGGLVETAREVGGALGTAVVASVAIARADDVLATLGSGPANEALALTEGFQRGSLVAAGFSVVGAIVALTVLRPAERAAARRERPAAPVDTLEPALAD